jgi:cysteinyl-tRNA synthetase
LIKDVLKSFHPEVVRLFLLSNHYRSPIDFSEKAMNESSSGLDKIYKLLERIQMKIEIKGEGNKTKGTVWKNFSEAMNDDFNTARGIGVLFSTVREINRLLDDADDLSTEDENTIRSAHSDIIKIGRILGILSESPINYFDDKKASSISQKSIDSAKVDKMVQERFEARKSKDWEKADSIRKQLERMNIKLEDGPDGTVWTIK